MPRNLVLTPIPFTLTEVPLGSIVTDILHPHRSVKIIKPLTTTDSKSENQQAFDGTLTSSLSIGFFAQLTRLLHLSRDTSANISLHVTSSEGKEHWLKEPDAFWDALLTSEETKKTASEYLSALGARGREAWFVTATRTFVDATVEVENGEGSEWKIEANVPAGQIVKNAAGMSGGDDGGAGDIGGGVTRTRKGGTKEKFFVAGERIFVMEFRKVILKKRGEETSTEVRKDPVIRILPEFRRGGGVDVAVGTDYLVALDVHGDTLEDYADEAGNLEESDSVGIISDPMDTGGVYFEPKWVEYTEPQDPPNTKSL